MQRTGMCFTLTSALEKRLHVFVDRCHVADFFHFDELIHYELNSILWKVSDISHILLKMEKGVKGVQEKVSCIYQTVVVEEPSAKRSNQPYKVVASDTIKQVARESDIESSLPSEKIDGTCVYINEFEGKPWLWARHDRKPVKMVTKKFKKFQNDHRAWQAMGSQEGQEPKFLWDTIKDFKDVPEYWVPANGVPLKDGIPQPDDIGHIPGWVPIEPKSRQHCWHSSAVDLDTSVALVLTEKDEETMQIVLMPLAKLVGCTLELIGTNINANPYQLGTKQEPFHVLVQHGSITFKEAPPLDFQEVKKWFESNPEGHVEGIVWHCENGKLFKLHRHHVGLKWPVDNLKLNSKKVLINVDLSKFELDATETSQFVSLSSLNGNIFDSLKDIKFQPEI